MQCGRPLLLRQPFAPDAFDQVILGCVSVIADEMNPARVAALRLGMGEAMTAFTVQINCGSGMQSIDTARQRGLINDAEADQLKAVQLAIAAVVAVDDFPAEEITRHAVRAQGDVSSPTATPFQSNAAE